MFTKTAKCLRLFVSLSQPRGGRASREVSVLGPNPGETAAPAMRPATGRGRGWRIGRGTRRTAWRSRWPAASIRGRGYGSDSRPRTEDSEDPDTHPPDLIEQMVRTAMRLLEEEVAYHKRRNYIEPDLRHVMTIQGSENAVYMLNAALEVRCHMPDVPAPRNGRELRFPREINSWQTASVRLDWVPESEGEEEEDPEEEDPAEDSPGGSRVGSPGRRSAGGDSADSQSRRRS